MKLIQLIRTVASFVYIGVGVLHAQTQCDESAHPNSPSAASTVWGRQYLGQGVALFDAKNYKLAERALQSALFVGLPDAQERVLAHKYLAFVYCTAGEQARCEAEFDDIFALRPSFKLADYESRNESWRDSYLRSQSRSAARCNRASASATASVMSETIQTTASPSVAVAISSSLPRAVPALAGVMSTANASTVRRRDTRQDGNVRLRVGPWASVQVDGKQVGVTPPVTRLKLSPGSHSIKLSNPGSESLRQVIRVVDGETLTISHDFETR